jgi:acetolactate synthase-1/2/3 large subunit
MLAGRKGPVWIDVPLDIQGAQIDPDTLEGFLPPAAAEVSEAQLHAQVEEVLRLIRAAERPLILVGQGVRLAGASKPFRELVDRLGIPVVATWNALDLIPWEHPLCVGRQQARQRHHGLQPAGLCAGGQEDCRRRRSA